jgi:hypothetical protein
MPYDANAYRPSNSQTVPGYAGNTLKEYSDLMNNKQEKYDTGVELAGRFGEALQNVVALDKDKGALTELYNKHSEELANYAKSGNYEDLVPRITRSARQFTSDYQPFAARYQQKAAYVADLQKKLTAEKPEDRISQEQYALALAASERQDKGMTVDPLTGKHIGNYNGFGVVAMPDKEKIVDEIFKDRAIHKTGYDKVTGQGEYVMVTEHGNVKVSAAQVEGMVREGLKLNSNYRTYMDNLTQLKTGAFDDTLVRDPKQVIEQNYKLDAKGEKIPIKDAKGKKTGQYEVKDSTLEDLMKEKGRTAKDILLSKSINDGYNNDYTTAVKYAMHKYFQDDNIDKISNLQESVDSKNAREREKDWNLPTSFTVNLKGVNSNLVNHDAMETSITTAKQTALNAQSAFHDWLNDPSDKKKMVDANGKPTDNINQSGAKFINAAGEDVTTEGLKFIMAHNQAKEATGRLAEQREKFAKLAGLDLNGSPEVKKQAQEASNAAIEYNNHYKNVKPGAMGGEKHATMDPQVEYKKVIESSLKSTQPEAFERYNRLLKAEATKSDVIPTGVIPFRNPKLTKVYSDGFNNLVVNLDKSGVGAGALGLTWATGEKAGKPLDDTDYKEMIGKAEHVGNHIDPSTGVLMSMYKVGTDKLDAKGNLLKQSALVTMPAPTNAAEQMVHEGQTDMATLSINQQIIRETNSGGPTRVQVGGNSNDYVTVEPVTTAERSMGKNHSTTYYKVKLPNNAVVSATSPSQATNQIIMYLKSKK